MTSSLVTGGQGFIGGHLVRALLERGDEVTVLDLRGAPGRALDVHGLTEEVRLVEGDVADPAAVHRAVREAGSSSGPDSIFHLAAQTLVGPAAEDPVATFRANVEGTWTILEAARETGVGAVVVASSDKAYGPSESLPYRESDELRPAAPYEASKAAADVISRSYWPAFGVPVGVTRLANVYGGGDMNGSRLVPETVNACLEGRSPQIRSDGSPQRDYLHVSDAAAAYLAIEGAVLEGSGRGEALNAGTGEPHSVREVIELITAEVARTGVEPVEAEYLGEGVPEGEIDRQFVDASRLTELTGWRPRVDLADGISEAVGWYRSHHRG
ncbi:MAG: SDR family NAD(P)-dependent oxidoreductase [Solirubrobacterales bacterium]|nr:SDR family NAD(P)-dependent oxidoreductase [Solirubrobacterales bacterium]